LFRTTRALYLRPSIARPPLTWSIRSFANVIEKCPSLGDSISEGTVVSWNKAVGDVVNKGDVVCVLETDKVSMEIHCTLSGKILSLAAKEGDTVQVGGNLLTLDDSATGASTSAPAAAPKQTATAAKVVERPVESAKPAAKPAAAAPKAMDAAAAAPQKPAASKAEPVKPASLPSSPSAGSRAERVVPMSRMRQTIAKRLKDSQNTAALLTTFNEVDMTNIMALRKKYQDEFFAKHGTKLGFMSVFCKASAAALQAFPDTNAFFDLTNKQIVYRDYVDISVAVGTPTGLVTPVLRNVESMSFAGVESAIAALGKKARDGQITLEDLTGGTFTISNGGVYGSLMGTPIVNPPQSAILGMHGIFNRPVAIGDKVEIRPMMYIALTYDHRIIDGSTAVQTLKAIKNGVEDPARMVFNL